MPAVIFNGAKTKNLKDELQLLTGSSMISRTTDPTAVAVDAIRGSLLLNTLNGNVYRKLDDGSSTNWEILGSGAGGINYIVNNDAEVNTNGWATYANAAGPIPVDGVGGSPVVTWTRTTSSPLRGTGSFLFTKDAANRQGEGVAYDFTIDSADLAKVLQISFDYEIASGTYSGGSPSANSDLIAYIYRVTATGRLIEPTPIKLDGGVVGTKYKFQGEFQTDSDATQYRLILHVSTTSALAYTVKCDNFVVGPAVFSQGSVVTEWASYSPTLTNIGNATAVAAWRRVGDSMQIRGVVTIGATPPNASGISFGIPAGYTIDQSAAKGGDSTSSKATYGHVESTSGGAQYYVGALASLDDSHLYPAGDDGSGQWTDIVPFTWATGNSFTFFGEFPVVGFGATSTLGQDTDTRVEAAYVESNNNPSITANTPFQFDVVTKDTHGTWDAVNWRYYAAIAGEFKLEANLAASGGSFSANVWKNGVNYKQLAYLATTIGLASGSLTLHLDAGEYVDLRPDATVTQSNSGQLMHMEITRVSGPSQIAASEQINAKYDTCSSAVASGDTLVFSNKVWDTHNAYNASTGIYTVPAPGKYSARMGFVGDAHSAVATDAITAKLDKNAGAQAYDMGRMQYQVSASLRAEVAGTTAMDCVAGDQLKIILQNSFGATITGNNTADNTWVEFFKED